MDPVNLDAKLALVREHWHPYIVGQVDGYYVKIAKVQGEFVWHTHEEQDEFFLVLDGELTVQMRDRDIVLGKGDMFVVPRGVEHCPRAERETAALVFERVDAKHTGADKTAFTIDNQEWI